MVYLTMTSTVVEALEKIQSINKGADEKSEFPKQEDASWGSPKDRESESALDTSPTCEEKSENARMAVVSAAQMNTDTGEPSLSNPKLGNPISHGQVIDLSRALKAQGLSPSSLDMLLNGARVYVAPPAPKPEPVSTLSVTLS
jgi:hypothetical protein